MSVAFRLKAILIQAAGETAGDSPASGRGVMLVFFSELLYHGWCPVACQCDSSGYQAFTNDNFSYCCHL